MTSTDSNKRFGLIGLGLIVGAFIIWAFVLPCFNKPTDDQKIDTIISQPVQKQNAPERPITDPAAPPIPTPR